MKKILIPLLMIPAFLLLIIGLVLFDYVYFPLISAKAEKAAEKHLEEKYGENFVIDDSRFSKPLGDDSRTYHIDSHPAKNPKLTVRIAVTEDMEPLSDDYVDMKWRQELNKQFGSLYKDLYGPPENYSYMVNVSFPDEAYEKYDISTTYQEIFDQEHKEIGNIVFANVLLNSSDDLDHQLDLVYKLIEHLNDQELNYFNIRINYFNEKTRQDISEKDKRLDYKDFLNKHLKNRDYMFYFSYDTRNEESVKKLDAIKSSTQLKHYLQNTRNWN